jgi:glycosyltransferase involved in cell wall biosynthesis
MKTLSIIIPAKNEKNFISECLTHLYESLKYLDITYEIIVVADNCSDDTIEIAQRFSCKIFSVNFNNRSKSKNFGFLNSEGEFLIFLDADTFISEELIFKTLEILNKTNKSVVFYKQDQIEYNVLAVPYFRLVNFIGNKRPTFSPTISCKREYFRFNYFDDTLKSFEDIFFMNKAFSKEETILCDAKVFTSIRRFTKLGLIYSLFLFCRSIINPYKYEWKPIMN